MNRTLLAGATAYLGRYVTTELLLDRAQLMGDDGSDWRLTPGSSWAKTCMKSRRDRPVRSAGVITGLANRAGQQIQEDIQFFLALVKMR